MPDPSKYETEQEFMEACIPQVMDEGKTHKQAVGQCAGMWRDHQEHHGGKALARGLVRNVGSQKVNPANLWYQEHQGSLPLPPTRAYSVLEVKSIDSEQRTIEGIASTPSVDRIGDIVEPLGAKFTLPIPLLHHHQHNAPVGHVIAAKAGKDGISVKARLAKITEPGALKDRVDLAWQEIKAGLIRGLSIGFKPIDMEPIDPKDPFGGLRFSTWNWYELSLVTIPANADAQISVVRSIDQGLIAASGGGEGVTVAEMHEFGESTRQSFAAASGNGEAKASLPQIYPEQEKTKWLTDPEIDMICRSPGVRLISKTISRYTNNGLPQFRCRIGFTPGASGKLP
jgi:Escherichia/Staphylococcus phage prohead protease